MSALEGQREALLLSAQGESGKRTAAASEAGIIRGLTATAAESGRSASAGALAARAGSRDRGGLSIQRSKGGTTVAVGAQGGGNYNARQGRHSWLGQSKIIRWHHVGWTTNKAINLTIN